MCQDPRRISEPCQGSGTLSPWRSSMPRRSAQACSGSLVTAGHQRGGAFPTALRARRPKEAKARGTHRLSCRLRSGRSPKPWARRSSEIYAARTGVGGSQRLSEGLLAPETTPFGSFRQPLWLRLAAMSLTISPTVLRPIAYAHAGHKARWAPRPQA